MATRNICVLCGDKGSDFYGYIVCDACKSRLGLFSDNTIKKHIALYAAEKDHSYEDELRARLDILEKDYIMKKIKLLYILDRLENF